jgi:hypothetical protein
VFNKRGAGRVGDGGGVSSRGFWLKGGLPYVLLYSRSTVLLGCCIAIPLLPVAISLPSQTLKDSILGPLPS